MRSVSSQRSISMQSANNLSPSSSLIPQVLAAAKARILAFSQVQAVLTSDEIGSTPAPQPPVGDWTLYEKARASYDRERSGDLLVFLKPRVIPERSVRGHTTTHGSPWTYG